MAMTKKDYELIADTIKREVDSIDDTYRNGGTANAVLTEISVKLSRKFKASNDRFDGARFLKACGVEA